MQSEHSHQMPGENFEPAAAWTRPRTYPAVEAAAVIAAEVETMPQASAAIRTGIQWDVHAPTGTRIQKSPLSLFAAAANSITLSVGGREGGKVGNVVPVGGRETGKYGGIGLQRVGRLLPEAHVGQMQQLSGMQLQVATILHIIQDISCIIKYTVFPTNTELSYKNKLLKKHAICTVLLIPETLAHRHECCADAQSQIGCQAPASTTPSIASQDSDTPMHRRAPDLFLM